MKFKKIITIALALFVTLSTFGRNDAHTMINVTDYGLDPYGVKDCAAPIQKAIAAAKEANKNGKPVTIYFPKGVYHFWEDYAFRRTVYISNTQTIDQAHKTKKIGILIEDMKNVTVDGGGSLFVFHGDIMIMAAIHSENVTFTNFEQDFYSPSIVDVTVEEKGEDYSILYVPECYDYSIDGANITWSSDKSPVTGKPYFTGRNMMINQCYDKNSGRTWRNGPNPFRNAGKIEDVGNRRIKITYTEGNGASETGYCHQMRYFTERYTAGMLFWESKNTSLTNAKIHFLHGFGIVAQYTENVTFDNLEFSARPGNGRTSASFADFLQMSGAKGKVKVNNCTFANPQDDVINVHAHYMKITGVNGSTYTVVSESPEAHGFPKYYPGDEVEFLSVSTGQPAGKAIVRTVAGPLDDDEESRKTIRLTFDKPVYGVTAGNHIVENLTYTPEVEITNNRMAHVPTRGILCSTRRRILIENNRFDGMNMAAILVVGETNSSYRESGAVHDMTIRKNVFNCPYADAIRFSPALPESLASQGIYFHKNILIEDNTFNISPGVLLLYARDTDKLTFRNNLINPYRSIENTPVSKLFDFDNCGNVTLQNNKSHNTRHPQLLYWFWDDATIKDGQYLKDIDKIAEKSPFDMLMITSRFADGQGFWRTDRLKPHLKEAVRHAHEKGIKVVLQLWPMNRVRELEIGDYPIATKDAEALITEKEYTLDADGKASTQLLSTSADRNRIIHAELLKIWLFKKTSEGFYDPETLVEASPEWVESYTRDVFSVRVSINAPKRYAGYTACILTKSYYHYLDVLSPEHFNALKKMLDAYSDIPFDGAALDENGNMGIYSYGYWKNNDKYMEERTWCDEFENQLRGAGISDPVRLLFDMRYAPENHPEVRIKAINVYFDERMKGPVQVENRFRDHAKKRFGKDAFIGCHSTFHNTLHGVDVWTTGNDWWDLPREYGQTDEAQPMPDRMGIGISGTQPVMYNMYYNRDKEKMLDEAVKHAAFGVRQHYHAWNDVQGWGKDVRDDDFLEDVTPVERRIRLLNSFDPAPPRLSILVVYGFPYLLNWFPDANEKGRLGVRDIPGDDMQQTANKIWEAGYPCASIPSTWLERGLVAVRKDGKVQIKDRVFDAVVFLYPQYSKPSVLSFLKELTGKNGRLMIAGDASMDFYGNDCSDLYRTIVRRALPFSIENIGQWGVSKNTVVNGTYLQDGSVVMSDYVSIKNKTNTEFKVKIGKNEYSGSYEGIFALKTDKNGDIEKMVCGNFKSLQKNGKTILELKTPADVFVSKEKGKTAVYLK